MWPDGLDPELDGEPELADLSAELTAAGLRARRAAGERGAERPDPAFATALRSRLTAGLPAAGANVAAPAIASASSWARGSATLRRLDPESSGPVTHLPAPLRSRTRPRASQALAAPRWSLLAAAAAIVIAVVALNSKLLFPALPEMRAAEAAGATLVRAGAATALEPGTELQVGDEIRVASDGHATLAFGASLARLAGGASLRIDDLESKAIALEQLSGLAWHRVVLANGGQYVVRTGPLMWSATGTAFDIDREPDPSGGELVRERSIEHDVVVDGPGLEATVTEGRTATVHIGESVDIETADIDPGSLTDPWLIANARRDRALGLPIGMMTGVDLEQPTPRPTAAATIAPAATSTLEPTAAPTPDPTPMPTATPKPAPKPTPHPTPPPTPAPTLGTVALSLKACDGGVVLAWSKFAGDRFNHYTALRNSVADIPLAYPPAAGAVDFGTTYTTDPFKIESYDASADPGLTAYYRAMAFDAENGVIAASAIVSTLPKAVLPLGGVAASQPGGVQFDWTSYGGPAACFSYYKLVGSKTNPDPSYLGEGGLDVAIPISDQSATTFTADPGTITPGTYWFRIQAIRATSLGKFIAAQTDVVQYTVN